MQKKGSPSKYPIWKEKDSQWFLHFSDLMYGLCYGLSQSSFDTMFVCLYFVLIKKQKKIWKIQKQCVFVYTLTCVPWMAFETKFLTLYLL